MYNPCSISLYNTMWLGDQGSLILERRWIDSIRLILARKTWPHDTYMPLRTICGNHSCLRPWTSELPHRALVSRALQETPSVTPGALCSTATRPLQRACTSSEHLKRICTLVCRFRVPSTCSIWSVLFKFDQQDIGGAKTPRNPTPLP